MCHGWGRWSLRLLLLVLLTLPGDGNEGSITGNCPCDKRISSDSPPSVQFMDHLRKHLKGYHRCLNYVRFHLPFRSVCGGSKDQWVQELMRCFDLQGSLWKSLDEELPHPNETTTPTVEHRLGAGHKTEEYQKQVEESAGPKAGTSPIVPNFLGVIFLLTGILV